jgi:mortality factor 4-like protein 1
MRLLKLNEAGFAKRRALLEAQSKKNRPVVTTDSPAPSTKGKETKAAGKKAEGSRKRGRDTGLDTVS